MNIEISDRARKEINEIASYIAKDSIYYAKKTVNEIYDRIISLGTGIYMGRKVPELNDDTIHELLYKNYRIIFEIKENDIKIAKVITIFHSSREFENAYKSK